MKRFGLNEYKAVYEALFVRNLRRYSSVRRAAKRLIERLLDDPYHNTEALGDVTGKLNLLGCRSARIDRNFRVIFVICEECRQIEQCEFCLCEGHADKIIVFLTVGPHDRAYAIK